MPGSDDLPSVHDIRPSEIRLVSFAWKVRVQHGEQSPRQDVRSRLDHRKRENALSCAQSPLIRTAAPSTGWHATAPTAGRHLANTASGLRQTESHFDACRRVRTFAQVHYPHSAAQIVFKSGSVSRIDLTLVTVDSEKRVSSSWSVSHPRLLWNRREVETSDGTLASGRST